MSEFFKVATPERVFEILAGFNRVGVEKSTLRNALGRVAAEDIFCLENMPPHPRASMDGYAVKAEDTFGASDSIPALLKQAGSVEMGKMPDFTLAAGYASAIPTGGFLPQGADSVVMIEYTNRTGTGEVEISRPAPAGDNVIGIGEDISSGALAVKKGQRLRSHDIGMLAGLGVSELLIYKRPRAAVLSTGNEIVPIDAMPSPGCMRDINGYAICALVEEFGGEALHLGIVPDEPDKLAEAIEAALASSDAAVLSGGSSVGLRDLLADVAAGLDGAEILAHGIAVSPGKPTLLASVRGKPLFGLPGHPVSALMTARIFLAPFLRYLEGEELTAKPAGASVSAILSSSAHSQSGREEYMRVRLEKKDDVLYAIPVFGRSGAISALTNSEGFFIIPIHSEGIAKGTVVDVFLF